MMIWSRKKQASSIFGPVANWPSFVRDGLIVTVSMAMASMLGVLMAMYLDEENVIGVYLLAIVVISLTCGKPASLISCVLSVLCFDVFIIPPRGVLTSADPELIFSFAVMLVVATCISHLTSRTKALTDDLELRVQQRTLDLQQANNNLRNEVQQRLCAEKSMESLVRELTASNAVLSQMARIASHDLQEPLRVIQGYVDLFKRRYSEVLDADGQEFLGFISSGTRRMEDLIQGILSHARIKHGVERFQSTDTNQIVGDALSNIAVAVQQSGATITYSTLPTVLGDRTQILQLFQNLILNAIRFRSEEPLHIEIAAERDGNLWHFSVTDNGIGIDKEFHDEIFGMFKRLSSTMHPSGTGIGLAICKSVVENHAGSLWVESAPGDGSTFHFLLPGVSNCEVIKDAKGIANNAR